MILFILSLVILFIFLKFNLNKKFLLSLFKQGNVIVFGKKGKGKDLIFQKIISTRKKEHYYSNISYGYKYNKLSIHDLSVEPNTYDDFINENITKIDPTLKEKTDAYISDGGVYLPSHQHGSLNKRYQSLPIFYALSRHLYLMNIHVNTQSLSRVWLQLREQADSYIKALKTVSLFGLLLLTKVRYYETYESASLNILPMKKKFLNKYNNGLQEQFYSTHGEIRDFWIVNFKKDIKYNTRAFKNIIFK